MKKLFFIILVATLFAGCSKDQIVVNEINGSWTTSASTVNGNDDWVAGDTWVFNKCEITQGACTGSYSVPTFLGTLTSSFTYNVYNTGTKISIDFSQNYSDISDVNIVEQTTTRLRVNYTDSNGYHEKTLTKK